jgi:exodeoxyribonuclease VII large subunit
MDKLNFDLILIARGGGSLEDLYGYSNPKIIESLYNCKTFTMSAIGHEIDFMLSDFAADYRAPTPSIAGEVISNLNQNYNNNFILLKDYFTSQLKEIITNKLNKYNLQLSLLQNTMPNPLKLIDNDFQKLNDFDLLINNKIKNKLAIINTSIITLENSINNYNHDKMLNIGYSLLLSDNKAFKNKAINSLKDLEFIINNDIPIKIKLIDGFIDVVLKKN